MLPIHIRKYSDIAASIINQGALVRQLFVNYISGTNNINNIDTINTINTINDDIIGVILLYIAEIAAYDQFVKKTLIANISSYKIAAALLPRAQVEYICQFSFYNSGLWAMGYGP